MINFPLDNRQKYIKSDPEATEKFTQKKKSSQIKKCSQTIAQLEKYELLPFNVLLSNKNPHSVACAYLIKNRTF